MPTDNSVFADSALTTSLGLTPLSAKQREMLEAAQRAAELYQAQMQRRLESQIGQQDLINPILDSARSAQSTAAPQMVLAPYENAPHVINIDETKAAMMPQSTLVDPTRGGHVAHPFGIAGAAEFPEDKPGFATRAKRNIETIAEGIQELPGVLRQVGKEIVEAGKGYVPNASYQGMPLAELRGDTSGEREEEKYPTMKAAIEGQVEWYKGFVDDPMQVIHDEPISVALEALGALGTGAVVARGLSTAGVATRAAETGGLISKLSTLSDAKSVRVALQKSGVPAKYAKTFAHRIAGAASAADKRRLIAKLEKAAGMALTETGATRGAEPLKRLTKFEGVLKKHSAEMASLTEDFKRSLSTVFGGKAPPLDKVLDLDESIRTYNDMQAALAESAQRAMRARRLSPKQAARAQRVYEGLSEDLHNQMVYAFRKTAGVPMDKNLSLESLQKVLDEYQGGVSRAKSLYEAEMGKWDKHTPAQLADTPLHDLAEDLSPSGWAARKSWITKAMRKSGLSNLFGAEERILDRTPTGSEMKVLSARMRRDHLRLEAPDHIALGDIAHAVDRQTRNLMRENYRKWMDLRRPTQMKMRTPGGEAVMDVPQEFFDLANMFDAIRQKRLRMGRRVVNANIQDLGEKYLPKQPNEDMLEGFWAKSGEHYEALKDWAVSQGKDVAEIEKLADAMFPKTENPVRRSGSWEHPRLLDIPERYVYHGKEYTFLKTDPFEIMSNYVTETSRRASFAHHFGPNGEKFLELIRREKEVDVQNSMKYAFRALQGISDGRSIYTNPGMQFLLGAETVSRGLQLSGASIPNLTGTFWVARKWGLANALKAQWRVLQAKGTPRWNPIYSEAAARDLQIAHYDNAWAKHTFALQGETESLIREVGLSKKIQKGTRSALRVTGLEIIERNTNKVAALASQYAVDDMLKRLVRHTPDSPLAQMFGMDRGRVIRELQRDFAFSLDDINRMGREGMSAADVAQISQRAPALVNAYNRGPLQTRQWMRHPMWQRALAYTSWRLARGQMVWSAIDEFRLHGNMAPLLKELGYGTAAGKSVVALQDLIFNRGQEDETFYMHLADELSESAALGVVGSIIDNYQYTDARGIGSKVFQVFEFPMFSTLNQLGKAVLEASKPGGEFVREAVKIAPALRVGRNLGLLLSDRDKLEMEKRLDLFKQMQRRQRDEQKPFVRKLTGF